jgi:hypothetical protein
MQRIQKFMPLFFSVIYIGIPAAVNIYFIVSSLARIGQQELMFRYDPQVRSHAPQEKSVDRARDKGPIEVKEVKPGTSARKPGSPAQRRGSSDKAGGDGQPRRDQRDRSGDRSQSNGRSKAIESKATNGSKSSDDDGASKASDGATSTSDGDGAPKSPERAPKPSGGTPKSPDGRKSGDGSRADWSKAPRQKPHQRSQSRRSRRSR